MDRTVVEVEKLLHDLGENEPSLRERAAAGQFLGSIYMGVENIMKRIIRYYGLEMPEGEHWHVNLFRRFVSPTTDLLPLLFPQELASRMKPFRKFRHVSRHGYALELEWERMREGGTARVRPLPGTGRALSRHARRDGCLMTTPTVGGSKWPGRCPRGWQEEEGGEGRSRRPGR